MFAGSVPTVVETSASGERAFDVYSRLLRERVVFLGGELNDELASGSGRGSALPREVLREISAGVRSVAEADARTLVQRSGLPIPRIGDGFIMK